MNLVYQVIIFSLAGFCFIQNVESRISESDNESECRYEGFPEWRNGKVQQCKYNRDCKSGFHCSRSKGRAYICCGEDKSQSCSRGAEAQKNSKGMPLTCRRNSDCDRDFDCTESEDGRTQLCCRASGGKGDKNGRENRCLRGAEAEKDRDGFAKRCQSSTDCYSSTYFECVESEAGGRNDRICCRKSSDRVREETQRCEKRGQSPLIQNQRAVSCRRDSDCRQNGYYCSYTDNVKSSDKICCRDSTDRISRSEQCENGATPAYDRSNKVVTCRYKGYKCDKPGYTCETNADRSGYLCCQGARCRGGDVTIGGGYDGSPDVCDSDRDCPYRMSCQQSTMSGVRVCCQ